MASLAMAPALPASAQAEWGYSTEITNVGNGAHWAVESSSPAVESTTVPLGVLGPRAQWNIDRQHDGTVTIRNEATGQCAETFIEPNARIFTAPCNTWDVNQKWNLTQRWDGFVISPAADSRLAVVASTDQHRDTPLVLGVRPYDTNDTPNAVFRLNY
ncbi:RICIN domain-containing protein [Saccharopolyspora sp. NPDC000359]|uniref:RICIN domain-containing protein n=1 Tax=Saccharopolyspora sp. NPDC000359 TaxID=3154251 RepID=UPI003324C95D